MEIAIAKNIAGFVKSGENVTHKNIDHLQIKNAQLMEEVIVLKNELATLKGSPQAEAMKAIALKKLATRDAEGMSKGGSNERRSSFQ